LRPGSEKLQQDRISFFARTKPGHACFGTVAEGLVVGDISAEPKVQALPNRETLHRLVPRLAAHAVCVMEERPVVLRQCCWSEQGERPRSFHLKILGDLGRRKRVIDC